MHKFKRWEDLTITDDFMFSQVMRNEEICKALIEIILHIKVGKIEFLTSQHEIDNTPPGGLYSKMKDNYVIFICTFDPFLQGKAFYKFENFCLDCNPPLPLKDGTYKIFLNTTAEDLSLLDPELKLFYDYIRRGTADSTLTEKIDDSITELKKDRETRRKYMTYTTRMAEAKSEAREEGIKYGISLGVQQKAIETTKILKSSGVEINIITNSTGLSPEEIEKL